MRLAVLATMLLATAGSTAAQTVRGVVVEEGTGVPLRGAFLVLLDSAGVTRGATLSDSTGRFFLQARRAGSFAVRAELIGYEAKRVSTVVDGSQSLLTIALPIAAVRLDAVKVSSERRCTGRPERTLETARVWEEVRKALTVASWSEKENRTLFEVRRFERFLHPRTNQPIREEVTTKLHTGKPYAAIPADTLARYGFVRTFSTDSVLFYGPDADVLLSDVFLDTHCFWLKRGERGTSGLIGLAFEPIRGRELRDVTGTLWVDTRTAELKFIEFRYTNLERDLDLPGMGGRTDFRRMPSGAWIVGRWFIRLPARQRSVRGYVASALVEGGGEIVNAVFTGSDADAMQKTRVSGLVYDSVRGKPLANAMVYLSGTSHRTTTDSIGRFTIDDVPQGHYVAAVWHASFDSLPAMPDPLDISVSAAPTEVTLAIPALPTQLRRVCDGEGDGGVLVGYVRDADGALLPGETVRVGYSEKGRPIELKRETDRSGRFMVCGLPVDRVLTVKTASGAAVTTRIGATRFGRVDLVASGATADTR